MNSLFDLASAFVRWLQQTNLSAECTARVGDVFEAKKTTPCSGLYLVVHEESHVPAHETLCIAVEKFPACDICGTAVRFKLMKAVQYVRHSDDFQGPMRHVVSY